MKLSKCLRKLRNLLNIDIKSITRTNKKKKEVDDDDERDDNIDPFIHWMYKKQ
jgi:hypothetical protein